MKNSTTYKQFKDLDSYQIIKSGSNLNINYYSGSINPVSEGASININGDLKVYNSLENGQDVQSSGSYSHAEGRSTVAQGSWSHAEGNTSIAKADYSHAEGQQTQAIGEASHTEGLFTFTTFRNQYNIDSLTQETVILGASSVVEIPVYNYTNQYYPGVNVDIYDDGFGLVQSDTIFSSSFRSNNNSTDVWFTNVPRDTYIGFIVVTTPSLHGNTAHAEGNQTFASGDASHAEGFNNLAQGDYSHAEGSVTIATGASSHAEGNATIASGYASHAEGASTRASGNYSHAEGSVTIALGNFSHAEGLGTIASGSYQHVQGQYNISSSAQSAFIIGNGIADNVRSNLVFASGSTFQITGSLQVSGSITGSLQGTASFATQALSASWAPTFPFTGSAIITGSLTVTGSLNITYNTAATDGITVKGHYPKLILNNTGASATAAGGVIATIDDNFATKAVNADVLSISALNAGSSTVGGITFRKASSNSTNISLSNSGANTAIFISGSGNVGIATTTPTSASLTVNGNVFASSFTGSLFGTASWARNTLTASFVNPLNQTVIITGSLLMGTGSSLETVSYGLVPNLVVGMNTGSSGAVLDLRNTLGTSPAGSTLGTIQFSSYTTTSDYIASPAGIRATTTTQASTGNNGGGNIAFWTANTGYGDFQSERMRVNSSGQVLIGLSSSLDTTSKLIVNGSTVITGSLTITNNLTVLGSSSIQYISQSTLNIGTNIITINTFTPTARFGGLAIIDSGSSPQVSASFLYDSVQDEFIFVHRGTAASAITSSHFLLGPETYNDLGNELYLTANRIPKGTGIEHLNDSNISDDGSVVSINSNTQITGSLTVVGNQTISGSIYLRSGSVVNSVGADIFIKAGVGNNAGIALYNNSSTQYLAVDDTGSYANKFTVADRLTVQGLTTTQNQIVSGSITLAGGSKITNEYEYPSIDIQAGTGGYVELLSNNQSSSVIITNQDVNINTSGGAWIFGENGTTSYPANVIAASFTGSLQGSASYALTASYALNARTNLGLVQAMTVGLQNIF